jgi:hypothetical protein
MTKKEKLALALRILSGYAPTSSELCDLDPDQGYYGLPHSPVDRREIVIQYIVQCMYTAGNERDEGTTANGVG